MSEMLLNAHSGIRYLVLLVALINVLYALAGWIRRRPLDATAERLGKALAGVLDLQILIGVILLFVRPFFSALFGHIVMMVAAAVIAHVLAVRNRKRPDRKSFRMQFAATIGVLAVLIGGILAIGRGVV